MGFCLTCLAKYSAVPRGLGKTSQVAVEWGDCFIPRTADLEDKITTGARTRLKCKEAQFKLSWLKAIRGAAHGGRATVEELTKHPEIADEVHVVCG